MGTRRGEWRSSPPARRHLRLAVALVGAALVGGGAYAALSQAGGGGGGAPALTGGTGGPAPGFSLPELAGTGRSVSLGQLRGRDVVLNFWASWCSPCQAEMPVLQESQRAHPQVRFVGIDTNDTLGAARDFLRRVHVSYPVLYDPSGTVAGAYGLVGLPTTVFVSPNGKILGRHQGQLDAATLAVALRQAFGSAGG